MSASQIRARARAIIKELLPNSEDRDEWWATPHPLLGGEMPGRALAYLRYSEVLDLLETESKENIVSSIDKAA